MPHEVKLYRALAVGEEIESLRAAGDCDVRKHSDKWSTRGGVPDSCRPRCGVQEGHLAPVERSGFTVRCADAAKGARMADLCQIRRTSAGKAPARR